MVGYWIGGIQKTNVMANEIAELGCLNYFS
jgi:hypothetical protein